MAHVQFNALDKAIEQELDAARMLLEAPGRKVLIIGIVTEGDVVSLTHSVSEGTKGLDLLGFIQGIERKLQWFRAKMLRKA